MIRVASSLLFGGLVAGLSSCGSAPPPYGEVVVVVDTDVPVPTMVSRLRIDLFTEDGRWFDSRDVPARGERDWPVSFSVWNPRADGETVVRVRLRAFPEARTRPYFGETFTAKPRAEPLVAAHDLASLCSAPTPLESGTIRTVRVGPEPFLDVACGGTRFLAPAAALRIRVDRYARYRIAAVRERPRIPTMVQWREECTSSATALACADTRLLEPGIHEAIVFGNASVGSDSSADLDMLFAPVDEWDRLALGPTQISSASGPRLVRDGADATPASEPVPATAIDRLIEVRIRAGDRRATHVVLRGACAGSMAHLATLESCVGGDERDASVAEGTLSELTTATLEPFESRTQRPSVRGTFTPGTTCRLPADAERICMPGGAFLLGDREAPPLIQESLSAGSERPVRVDPFLIDRTELSFKRLGELVARGLPPPTFDTCATVQADALPVTCVSWDYARSACKLAGGDLPTEAQWEWAASASADRTHKRRFPWGDSDQSGCAATNVRSCPPENDEIDPVDGAPWASSDRTPFGVIGMLGNVSEWTVDAAAAFDAAPWRAVPVTNAALDDASSPLHIARGLHFAVGTGIHGVFARRALQTARAFGDVGFRCVYR